MPILLIYRFNKVSSMNNKAWFMVPTEEVINKMKEELHYAGPDHPLWIERVKEEIDNINLYIRFLIDQKGKPWFKLFPYMEEKFRFMIWKGYICIPYRKEVKFDIIVLLPKTYPVDCPRALIDEIILHKYSAEKIYTQCTYTDPMTNKTFVMLCHDHMRALAGNWHPSLTIAHFFIREINTWWLAMQESVLTIWDELHQ